MRIALVLPVRRLGTWHRRLLDALAKQHEVQVFADDCAPPYPWSLRAWLLAESRLYRNRKASSSCFRLKQLARAEELDESRFDVVIDLSERAQPRGRSISLRYDGSADSMRLVERLLAGQTPHLAACREDPQAVLAESAPAIDDKIRLTRALQLSFSRCISLVERALRSRASARNGTAAEAKTTASWQPLAHAARFVAAKARRIMQNRAASDNRWSVALRKRGGPFVPIADDGQRYYADPFLYGWCGRSFVFVEEYRHATKTAIIAAAEIIGDRPAVAPIPILERPYHLSYPFVFAEAGSIYMLPETSAQKTLELYRAVDFPWQWRLEARLIEGQALADATPIFHQDRWWLFAAASEHGTTDHDELVIFHSDRLAGPWRPHSGNPVKSDCRSARPAGRILRRGNRLFRPAQDCERSYGSGIVWNEIVELSPSGFREIEVARVMAPHELGIDGVHSFDQLGELQAIDLKAARGVGAERLAEAMPQLGRALDLSLEAMAPAGRLRTAVTAS